MHSQVLMQRPQKASPCCASKGATPSVAIVRLHAGIGATHHQQQQRQADAGAGQRRRGGSLHRVQSAGEAAAAVTTTQAPAAPAAAAAGAALEELNKDTFQPFLDAAGDKLVVVDFFTDWCGPCKLIYPQLVSLSAELEPAATIVKFNCNQYNKELAKALGIKVAPTFHIYKNGAKVADMTGAKVDKLRALIDDQLNPKAGAEEGDAQN